MARSSTLIFALILVTGFASAQEGKYAIFFKDKVGTTFSTNNPPAYLSQRSITRRIKNSVEFSEEDFPVNQIYIDQLKSNGAEILFASRWLNCAIVQLDDGELSTILTLPFVISSEFVSPIKSLNGGRIKKIGEKNDSNLSLVNQIQSSMIGLDDMHMDNIFGEGVLVGVFDSGFLGVDITDPFKSLFTESRLTHTLDIVGQSGNVFQYDDHGTEVLSIMAANQPGTYIGGIPKATYQLYVTEDVGSEFRIEEYNWLYAAEMADSAGVDIINSSLGYNLFDDTAMDYTTGQLDGNTAVVSIAASKALSKGIMIVVSAGNDGNTPWKLVNPPADVNGVLAVGSITGTGSTSNFSSLGPTADNRVKPDVVALGSSVSIIKANGNTGFTSGTSSSAPLITSLAVGLLEAFPELTVLELYDLIIASANMFESPDNQKGYGIPHYAAAKQILNGEEPEVPAPAIYLYPNPVVGNTLKVEIAGNVGQQALIEIYDLKGKLMMKSEGVVTYINNPVELDVSNFSDGLYIIKVKADGLLKTIRLIKL